MRAGTAHFSGPVRLTVAILARSRDLTVRRGNGVVWVEVTILARNILTYFARKTPVTTDASALS